MESQAKTHYQTNKKFLINTSNILRETLIGICMEYTKANNLPDEAIQVTSRVKGLPSFLEKLLKRINHPTKPLTSFKDANNVVCCLNEVAGDLIGARITCWFLEDCDGILEKLKESNNKIKALNNTITSTMNDKCTNEYSETESQWRQRGYRAIHIDVELPFAHNQTIKAEVQIRTKLQDAWGDLTHEFHYKAKNSGIDNPKYEQMLATLSNRLHNEDLQLEQFRDFYEDMAKVTHDSLKMFLESKFKDRILEDKVGQFHEIGEWIIRAGKYENIEKIAKIVKKYETKIDELEVGIEKESPQINISFGKWASSLLLIYILSIENKLLRERFIKKAKEVAVLETLK